MINTEFVLGYDEESFTVYSMEYLLYTLKNAFSKEPVWSTPSLSALEIEKDIYAYHADIACQVSSSVKFYRMVTKQAFFEGCIAITFFRIVPLEYIKIVLLLTTLYMQGISKQYIDSNINRFNVHSLWILKALPR